MTPLEVVARIAMALERIADAATMLAGGSHGPMPGRPNVREALSIVASTRFDDHTRYNDGCSCVACHARRTLEGL